MGGARIVAVTALVAAILLCLCVIWRRRRNRTKRLIGDLLNEYFKGTMAVEHVGQQGRKVASQRFLGGSEFFALAHAAFQHAADAKVAQGYSPEAEKRLLSLLGALKNEFGLPERYLIEGWRAGRE
jgi:hypothetical protein